MYGKLIIPALILFVQLGFSETSGNSLADGITSSTVHSADEVRESEVEQTGRENKAAQADIQGRTGSGMAIATGSSLMARAIPMLGSVIPFVHAAGVVLMSQAGMEFAQAGVNAGSSARNRAQNRLLTNASDDSVGNQTTASQIKNALNNPALDAFLAERGISGEEFKNQLASGSLTDPEAVRNALGFESISESDWAAGKGLAQESLNSVLSDFHLGDSGKAFSDSVQINENLESSSNSSATSEEVAQTANSSSESASANSELEVKPLTSTESNHSLVGSINQAASLMAVKKIPGTGLDPKSILEKLLGKDARKVLAGSTAAIVKENLSKIGIQVSTSKQSIFQTAHRNFRSFGKWRKTYRIAMSSSNAPRY